MNFETITMFGALFDAHTLREETIVFDPLLLPERGQRNSRGIQRLEVKLDVSMACTTDIHETGMVLWPVSRYLCWYLLSVCDCGDEGQRMNWKTLKGKSVIELGSGTGLCGLMLSCMGTCESVLLTDGEDIVMDVLTANCAKRAEKSTTAELLRWGKDCTASLEKRHFDIIIGADVLAYTLGDPELLISTVRAIMDNNGAEIFICGFSNRAENHRRRVFDVAKIYGLSIQLVPPSEFLPSPVPDDIAGISKNMQILIFRASA